MGKKVLFGLVALGAVGVLCFWGGYRGGASQGSRDARRYRELYENVAGELKKAGDLTEREREILKREGALSQDENKLIDKERELLAFERELTEREAQVLISQRSLLSSDIEGYQGIQEALREAREALRAD